MAPSTFLLDFIANLLAPLFLAAAGNDPGLARAAARQTISEYQARTGTELLLVAQTIVFGVASITAAVQSAQDDIPPQVARRLQAAANSLSRSADRARKALAIAQRSTVTASGSIPAGTAPDPAPNTQTPNTRTPSAGARARQPVGTLPKPVHGAPAGISPSVWADSFKDLAQEVAASLVGLSPRERHIADMQIAALQEAAQSLHAPPAMPLHRTPLHHSPSRQTAAAASAHDP